MNKQLKGIKVERIVHFLTCTILFCVFQELIQKFGTGKEQYLQYILTKSVIKAKINILNTPPTVFPTAGIYQQIGKHIPTALKKNYTKS